MNALLGGPGVDALLKTLGPLRRMVPGGDVGLALCVLFQLSILILPIPTFLLDMALALSFIASILILLISISLERPLDFSSLPTLLLLTTILRLSLNVATARLILSHGNEGPNAAGHVVAAFGTFLMGGDLVVGAIIFSMLLMVNFVVITKGSSRIAEVAARFYLDAMPGKQMAIDADLSSGTIDEPTARKRRSELSEESGFYGAMDGASKFVRGDAISALIITLINIFGGLAMGMLRSHMSLESALSTYTTLTVGDGLVSQIPALLVSTAAGIVVSKGAIEGQMHGKLASQLGSSPNPLMIASAAAGVLALLPGLPTLPFLLVSTLSGAAAWHRFNARNAKLQAAVPVTPPPDNSPPVLSALDVVRVELGYGLLELASGGHQQLPEQIKRLRRALAAELGFVLPSVRIQDNVELEPNNVCFRAEGNRRRKGRTSPADDAGDQPGRRHISASRRNHSGANVRASRSLDRSSAGGSGSSGELDRGRSRHRADDPPRRGGEGKHLRVFVVHRGAENPRRTAAGAAEAGRRSGARYHHRRRPSARAAGAARRADFDPRHADDPGGRAGGLCQQRKVCRNDRRACADTVVSPDQLTA